MTSALRGFGPFLQDSISCTHFISNQMERDLLIYQPDRPVDADKRLYRVAWYGGESTQLHFQKWGIVATPNFDGDYEWIDLNVRTLMEMPTRVKEMWLEMKDYYDFGVCEQLTYSLESCIR